MMRQQAGVDQSYKGVNLGEYSRIFTGNDWMSFP